MLTQGKQPVLQAQHAVIDCCLQALEAREAGLAEVCKLLAAPEDLARLEQLRAEVMPAAAEQQQQQKQQQRSDHQRLQKLLSGCGWTARQARSAVAADAAGPLELLGTCRSAGTTVISSTACLAGLI